MKSYVKSKHITSGTNRLTRGCLTPAGQPCAASRPLPVLVHLLWNARAFTSLVAPSSRRIATHPHLPLPKGIWTPLPSSPLQEAAPQDHPDLAVCSAPTNAMSEWVSATGKLYSHWSHLSSLPHAVTTNPCSGSCHHLWNYIFSLRENRLRDMNMPCNSYGMDTRQLSLSKVNWGMCLEMAHVSQIWDTQMLAGSWDEVLRSWFWR